MMKQRASDILDIKNSLLEILCGGGVAIEDVPKGSILIAKDFTPSMTSRINRENVYAVIETIAEFCHEPWSIDDHSDLPVVE